MHSYYKAIGQVVNLEKSAIILGSTKFITCLVYIMKVEPRTI